MTGKGLQIGDGDVMSGSGAEVGIHGTSALFLFTPKSPSSFPKWPIRRSRCNFLFP